MQVYIHKTNNRVRIRSDYIFENRDKVASLISELTKVDGILNVKHKKYAGSVAITFSENKITLETLLETLTSHHWLMESQKNCFFENAMRKGTKSVLKGVLMFAAKKALGVGVVTAIAAI
ncbi:hypothetical protein PCNPT3_02855 [Psychromonas sp. CNPT3]|uniref:HMA2 domain-containing protein n=1 Tax=Psychromonas sp. CNPT3 TaxID=314282 RepID=UPI00006E8A9B|nr:hypothetical protein [Psychromonas sp. CNPT3]AGH80513.1 hypothetical protein PCNPT3_02855 [Psychromonas sp. CNPT3]